MIKLSKKKLIIVLIISFLIVVLQIPQYFLLALKPASAANNYIKDIEFYSDTNGYLRFKFRVKTTFTENWMARENSCVMASQTRGSTQPQAGITQPHWYILRPLNYEAIDTSVCQDITYQAGQIYDTYAACYRARGETGGGFF